MRTIVSAVRILLFLICLPLSAQETGVPTKVILQNGQATLSLDFSQRDYQLILYSAVRDEQDSTRTYTFTVGGAFPAAKPVVRLANPEESETNHNKSILRKREAELARRIRRSGYTPWVTKQAVALLVGSVRSFQFDDFGDVSQQTVTATLAATNSRAEAWIDNNTSAITAAEVQSQIDRFSDNTYPVITSVFGAPSDVDGDGKVLFLYTELVDQVGGVVGFYSAQSLFSNSDGGNGNQADMMYIGLAGEDSFFESLLAHEFQHLISYNQHVLVRNGENEFSSINEAMSHVAEDLVDQHAEGGNPGNIRTYTENPEIYSLLSESAHASGARGTAYTFARSMIESFGDGVPASLVQTGLSGIANVEAVSGQTFEQVYETYLARMYLAGSGLNTSYDYSYPFFTDPATGGRSIPLPNDRALSTESVTITGTTKAFAASSIRLMGTGISTISIDTETAGLFKGVLIPIPRDFRHDIALKSDYFPGYTFDGSIPGTFTTGQNTRLTGSTSIAGNSEILFRFDPISGNQDTIKFRSAITNGLFDLNILFPHNQSRNYEMSIFAGRASESLPFVGRIPITTVNQGSGTVELPVNFFTGITFDAPLQTEIPAGESVTLSASISDLSVSTLLLTFISSGSGDEIKFDISVSDGSFEQVILFAADKEGSYELQVFAGQSGGSLPFVGGFPNFTVSPGSGTFSLPVNFFDGLTLDAPLPIEIAAGQPISLSGTFSDPSVAVVIFQFTSTSGDSESFQIDVSLGAFDKGVVFFPSQAGTYSLDVFAGPSGSLPGIGNFSPINVSEGSGDPVFLPVNAFSGLTLSEPISSEFYQGQSRELVGTLSDANVTSVAIRLDGEDGSAGPSGFATVSGGALQIPIPTSGLSVGSYTIVIFAGQSSGQSLPFLDSFGPVTIQTSQPRLVLDASTLTFGETEIGQTSQIDLAVSNVGSESLTLSNVSVASGPFTTSSTSTTASVGGNLTISITYSPTTVGVDTGTLELVTNDPTRATVMISLQGTGLAGEPLLAPQISVSSDGLRFPETLISESSALSFTVQNSGDASLSLDSLLVEGPFAVSSATATLAPGESFTIDITFISSAVGTFSGRVLVYSNASSVPHEVILSGSASAPPPVDPGTEPSLLGDIDGSGSVDFTDFLSFAGAFGTSTSDAAYLAAADLDESGSIDFTDFLTFASQFGKSL